jgi:hypothetical protein
MSAPQVAALQAASNPKNLAIVVGGAIVLVGGVYFFVYRPVMQKFGLIPDRQAIRKLNQIKDYKGFSPTFARPSKVTISSDRAKELAGQAYNGSWALNDNEGSLYAVLQEAGSPDNLSTIAKAYQIRYKSSMGEMYGNALNSSEEVGRVKDILLSYPA